MGLSNWIDFRLELLKHLINSGYESEFRYTEIKATKLIHDCISQLNGLYFFAFVKVEMMNEEGPDEG